MKCEYCDNPVPNGVMRCPSCGAAVSFQPIDESRQALQQMSAVPVSTSMEKLSAQPLPADQQSRVAYVLFGLFLGCIGVHNFYAGYVVRGVIQLLITVLSFGLLGWISSIWAVVEIIMVSKNAKGIPFR